MYSNVFKECLSFFCFCDVLFVVGFFRLLCSYGSTHSGTNFTKEKKNKFDENFGF